MKTKNPVPSIFIIAFFLFCCNFSFAQSAAKESALETIGMQGGIVLYNSYCYIGAINDGFVNKAWTKETCDGLLDEQISLMGKMYDQYNKLLDSKFISSGEDSASVVQMMQGVKLLEKEAMNLKTNIDSPTDGNAGDYNAARDAAWKLIADFLDLKDDAK